MLEQMGSPRKLELVIALQTHMKVLLMDKIESSQKEREQNIELRQRVEDLESALKVLQECKTVDDSQNELAKALQREI